MKKSKRNFGRISERILPNENQKHDQWVTGLKLSALMLFKINKLTIIKSKDTKHLDKIVSAKWLSCFQF